MMKRMCAPLMAAFAMLAMSGCVAMPAYVDPALGEVQPAERVQVAEKRPVQLVFTFQTNGRTNTMGTGVLSKRASELVTASDIFSQVSPSPVSGGAVLSITINNVAENSAMQGFVSNLPVGPSSPGVSDFYIATAKYTPGPAGAAITAERKHAIHSVTDLKSIPEGLEAAESFDAAIDTVLRQLLDHTLNDIARNPSFRSGT